MQKIDLDEIETDIDYRTARKIERMLFKVCLNLPEDVDSFIIDCLAVLSDENINEYESLKIALLQKNSVRKMLSVLDNRLNLSDEKTRLAVFEYIDKNFCVNVLPEAKKDIIEKLFADCPMLGKIVEIWGSIDDLMLARFSMPLSKLEHKLLLYMSLFGDFENACQRYGLSEFQRFQYAQDLLLKSGTPDLIQAVRIFLVTSYLNVSDIKNLFYCLNNDCCKIIDKIKENSEYDLNYKIVLESAISYEYTNKIGEKEKEIYLKTIGMFLEKCRDNFLDILTGKKILSKQELIERYYEKIGALKFYSCYQKSL